MAAQDEVDVCESWEDMDEIGLDRKIKLMTTETVPVKTSTVSNCKVKSVIVEESACIGSQCVMPEPAIRILKRPSSVGGQMNGESRARPVKTFQQRQKEYEEARLRILGEARSPQDVIADNLNLIQDKFLAQTLNDNQQAGKMKNSQVDANNSKGKEKTVLTRLPVSGTSMASGHMNGDTRGPSIHTRKEYEENNLHVLSDSHSQRIVYSDNLNMIGNHQHQSINNIQMEKVKSCYKDNAKGKDKTVLARILPGATASGIFPSPPPPGVLVIRTPRGPDGTKGFSRR